MKTRMPSPKESAGHLRELILDRWQSFEFTPGQYPWIRESTRWHELAFCLVARIISREYPFAKAHEIIDLIGKLGFLDIERLTALGQPKGKVNWKHPDASFLLQLLEREGISTERARAIVITLVEAAAGLHKRYHGRIQQYLRKYGQKMLDEVKESFAFSALGEEDVRYAFTHWFQNVLNMPIPISHPSILRLCKEQKVTVEELVELADSMDLNLALLDDVLSE
jgi:hypothetical protein